MLESQLKMLKSVKPITSPVISIEDLHDKTERTLLYGYTCERATHHVYIKNNAIHVALYDGLGKVNLHSIKIICNQDYVPDKRVYPARSDFEFCALLIRHSIDINFTEFNPLELERFVYGNYYGKLVS